jgi:hypothetical protein
MTNYGGIIARLQILSVTSIMAISFDEDSISSLVDLSSYDTRGLCENFVLRRNIHETEANIGSQEARTDWIDYIGPIEEFGGCNPFDGNFTSLVLPLCKPDRIKLAAYIHECEFWWMMKRPSADIVVDAFLYDNVLESAAKSTVSMDQNLRMAVTDVTKLSKNSDELLVEETKSKSVQSIMGTKQMQAKMILNLLEIDEECAQRVLKTWKTMVSTTAKRDKTKSFQSLEEYIRYRIIDTGAPYVNF